MKVSTKNIIPLLILLAGCTGPEGGSNTETAGDRPPPAFMSSFDYKPPLPVNGKLLGIIELGYSGFNSFVVEMDREDRWSLKKAIYSESYVGDGDVTFDHVFSKIEEFSSGMIEFGVNRNDINLVASSSAIGNEKVVEIASKLRQLDIGLITVSAVQEGNYALYATIPREFIQHSFMVDIGSGNTKISWVAGNEPKSIETFGSRYYEKETSHQEARIGVKEALALVPDKNRTLCFLVGKIPHLLAKSTNNRADRYTILEPPESYNFEKQQDLAGLNIYDALWQEVTVSYIFDWDSNFSIGVLMNVN